MAMSQEFLARIKLVMEGSADAAAKLQQIKGQIQSVDEPTKKVTSSMGDFEKVKWPMFDKNVMNTSVTIDREEITNSAGWK